MERTTEQMERMTETKGNDNRLFGKVTTETNGKDKRDKGK